MFAKALFYVNLNFTTPENNTVGVQTLIRHQVKFSMYKTLKRCCYIRSV